MLILAEAVEYGRMSPGQPEIDLDVVFLVGVPNIVGIRPIVLERDNGEGGVSAHLRASPVLPGASHDAFRMLSSHHSDGGNVIRGHIARKIELPIHSVN